MATLASGTNTTMAVVMLVLILIIVSSFSVAVVADAKFIARVCKNIEETNGHCVEVLRSDPRSFNATSTRDLASISLDIATSTRRAVAKGIDDEASKHDERSPVGEALIDCASYYAYAEQPLEDARESFDKGAYREAMDGAGEAEEAGDRCEQAFSDRELASVVAALDERMNQRCDVAALLIDLLFVT
jgi:pectinesterase inhibitor-like protein